MWASTLCFLPEHHTPGDRARRKGDRNEHPRNSDGKKNSSVMPERALATTRFCCNGSGGYAGGDKNKTGWHRAQPVYKNLSREPARLGYCTPARSSNRLARARKPKTNPPCPWGLRNAGIRG